MIKQYKKGYNMQKKIIFLLIIVMMFSMVPFIFATAEKEVAPEADPMPFKGQTLNLSWWGYGMDLLDKNVVKPFEEKYGVTVVSETGNNSARFTKMVARKGNPVIDVALFAGAWAYKATQEGIIQPYNPSLITNLDAIMESAKDPLGGKYAIGYTIQHLGLCYRTDKIDPITSWRDLSNDDLKGFLTIPQISTTYGPSIIYMLSKAWGGSFDATDVGWEKLEELSDNLLTAYVRSSELNTLILQEEVYAAPYASFAWGNILASELPIKNVIPEEGLVGSFSVISVAAGTKNEELAHLFIDHMLSYEVQLAEAMDLVDSPVRNDIKLPADIAANLTYGDELISQLNFFDLKEMASVEAEWLDKWNAIFTK